MFRDGPGEPLRLRRVGGNWELVVRKLVPKGAGILQPKDQAIVGEKLVRGHLMVAASKTGSSLAHSALGLLDSDDDVSFEVYAGGWIEADIADTLRTPDDEIPQGTLGAPCDARGLPAPDDFDPLDASGTSDLCARESKGGADDLEDLQSTEGGDDLDDLDVGDNESAQAALADAAGEDAVDD